MEVRDSSTVLTYWIAHSTSDPSSGLLHSNVFCPKTSSVGPDAKASPHSCHFVSKSGHTQLSPQEIDELGLCEECCPQSNSQAQGPHSNVCQSGRPALLTAEEHLGRETTVTACLLSLYHLPLKQAREGGYHSSF